MSRLSYIIAIVLLASSTVGASKLPKGMWLTPRKDPRNQARADVRGMMKTAPREVWRIGTGGEVGFVRDVKVGGADAALVLAGTTLQLTRWTGEPIWRDLTSGITSVLHIGDFDGDGHHEVFARTDARTVTLLDLATGKHVWSWQCDPSTQISGIAFLQTPTGVRFIAFPAYSLDGYCFDFSGDRAHPKLLWRRNYDGKYGEGYGPSVVLADMDGDGKTDVVISGKVPSVYQAVIDADTGEIKYDAHYSVEEQWGRPYGLLEATDLDGDGRPDLVMISCQVEEYAAAARNDGRRIEKLWDRFVEKDWPEDHKELRPQVTSLADLCGEGKKDLVVGVWEDDSWRTLIIDPLKGFSAQRGCVEGRYFWGCHDVNADGRPEIIVSEENKRRPSAPTTLYALDGKTLEPIAVLPDAGVFTSGDSPMPENQAFMALRANPVCVRSADGTEGILARVYRSGKEVGTSLWGSKPGQSPSAHPVAGPGFVRADVSDGRLCLTDPTGGILRFGKYLKPIGAKLVVNARSARPLVWSVDGKRQIVFDAAGGKVVGGVPDLTQPGKLAGRWEIEGTMPALHVDSAGVARVATASSGVASVRTMKDGVPGSPLGIPLDFPAYLGLTPFGGDFHLLANLQTGVHTMGLACYDAGGKVLWRDTKCGAHPRVPGAGDVNGDGMDEVVADDHGVLRVYDSAGVVLGTHNGWPPAYTLPIFVPGAGGRMNVMRACGLDAVTLVDGRAQEIWKSPCDRWRYYRCVGAVGDVAGDGRLALGVLAEDGSFDCISVESGQMLWSLEIGEPNETSVVAGDVDGDRRDEFVLGLGDGRLVCIGQRGGRGDVVWETNLGAGVANPIIADLDGNGLAEIIVSTSDGCLRVLR